ncbi:MAG: NYN domain-containing protein [Gammaproteobacteria bacterium]|nr:NYN domain-containing protein [Gammaproteobacteria bacterium]
MDTRVCVFVDGENLRHSIIDAFKGQGLFESRQYLPDKAKWAEFFDWIVHETTGPNGRRLRTYWYTINGVSFYPYGLKRLKEPRQYPKAREILSRNREFKSELSILAEHQIDKRIESKLSELIEEQQKIASRFDGWKEVQEGIAKRHRSIEFRRSGVMSYRLFEKKFGQEKAVDVKLACDMVILRDIYDVAIIVSGDQDYVPAVEIVKDSGKEVINVSFMKMNGEMVPGGARQLKIKTDYSFEVPYEDLKLHMGL